MEKSQALEPALITTRGYQNNWGAKLSTLISFMSIAEKCKNIFTRNAVQWWTLGGGSEWPHTNHGFCVKIGGSPF